MYCVPIAQRYNLALDVVRRDRDVTCPGEPQPI
jgi:hypothetical protein